MTRETKVGLLIGLGFIVVFAVLLSHTGPAMQTGDKLALGMRNTPGKVSTSNSTLTNSTYVPAEQLRTQSRSGEGVGSATTRPTNGRIGLSEQQTLPRGPRDTDSGSDRVTSLPLPRPAGIGRNRSEGTSALAMESGKQTEWEKLLGSTKTSDGTIKPAPVNSSPSNLPSDRVAPTRKDSEATMAVAPSKPVEPSPSARPTTSSTLALATATPDSAAHEMEPGGLYDTKAPRTETTSTPPVRQPASKDYVVQKGDTLRKIVKDNYGVTSTKAVEFLLASNKSRIKDRHMIIEGQKLVIPPLPPEMLEGTASTLDVTGSGDGVRTATSEDLSKALAGSAGKQRIAPSAVKKDAAAPVPGDPAEPNLSVLVKRDKAGTAAEKTAKADKADKSDKVAATVEKLGGAEKAVAIADKPEKSEKSGGYRVYEVKAGDTPRTISARELGSANHAGEILKLNPTLDPTRMKVGMKIKIPDKKPLASIAEVKQVSA